MPLLLRDAVRRPRRWGGHARRRSDLRRMLLLPLPLPLWRWGRPRCGGFCGGSSVTTERKRRIAV